jgi:hypothetical protein
MSFDRLRTIGIVGGYTAYSCAGPKEIDFSELRTNYYELKPSILWNLLFAKWKITFSLPHLSEIPCYNKFDG